MFKCSIVQKGLQLLTCGLFWAKAHFNLFNIYPSAKADGNLKADGH